MPSDVHNLVCCVQFLDPQMVQSHFMLHQGSPSAKMEFGNHQKWKMTFSQKFFWFDNIVQNQQTGSSKWLDFFPVKKLQLCTKVEFCKLSKSCVFFRLAWGFCERLQKGSQWSSRSNFRKCIISRVVSFLCKASTYDDRMNLRLQANLPKIGQIIDSLWSKQHRVLAPSGPRKWCSKLQLTRVGKSAKTFL